ncbi:hypothetical protein OK348_10275 [Flavobacterium sp. MXW15]|uniref:Uncharacterized protein n=1 Tax=Xanthomonas chitinilytica TaxID=2989819 RepID=A0ABT3JVY8_9XANT|nr:hypothetical protein [Xanthomonas sp. H13-6]MCW4455179.1 hypothetical protein [Flavobacterium sp. MXW15]MCW4472652.1 hypothetical protein [Xanthomonas sp. H13-6]
MYYMLECHGPDEEDVAAIGDWPHFDGVNWNLGRAITAPIRVPVIVELDPQFPGRMMPMFDSGVLLFSDEMIDALHRCGVRNFQCFDAVVKDAANNIEYGNYKVINIVGIVSAADLDGSVYEAHDGVASIDTDFDSLAIDESRTRGAGMFRLAEAVNGIVIHQRVKQGLEEQGIEYLDFVPPAEWIG